MKQTLFFILIILQLIAHPNEPLPGGVSGALVWNVTLPFNENKARWHPAASKNPDSSFAANGSLNSINFNPALQIQTGKNAINNSINLASLKSFSFFTVCQAVDSISEKVVFSLENDTALVSLVTTKRLADMQTTRYANYDKREKNIPKVYSYHIHRDDAAENGTLKPGFGKISRRNELPVSAYSGVVPELILFNRHLSFRERRKVESYLAIKYGVSLNQQVPSSYLNSRGDVIWNAELNFSYAENITAIGRDDLSGLIQTASQSSHTPGLTIGVLTQLADNSFYIWADNGQVLQFAKQSGIRTMRKEWKLTNYSKQQDSLFLDFSELSFDEIKPLKAGENYWLMIDESGSGEYPFGQTRYVKRKRNMNSGRLISYSPLIFDMDSSGSDVFTLLAAPSFFSRSILLAPSCSNPGSGAIQSEIVGGKQPYKLTLKNSDGSLVKSLEVKDTKYVFDNLNQGGYSLEIHDADDNFYLENIWMSNALPIDISLHTEYKMQNEPLLLDASVGMPNRNYTYAWHTSSGEDIQSEKIIIDNPGKYMLSILDEEGCRSTFQISVSENENSIIRDTELFPNPSSGDINLRISLVSEADVLVQITDIDGKTYAKSTLKGSDYYWYTHKISNPGQYLVSVFSGSENKTMKLIVY